MRFGTKILLMTLAITLLLSGIVVVAVTWEVTRSETARARAAIERTIEQYDQNLVARAAEIRRDVEHLTGEPEVRAYLHELQESTDEQPLSPEAKAQLEDEVLGRVLQKGLTKGDVAPAFHVLMDARGRMLMVRRERAIGSSATTEPAGAPLDPFHVPPSVVDLVLDSEGSPTLDIVLDGKIYAIIGVPVRVAFDEPPSLAYFVGYVVDDAWVKSLVGATTDLRVVIQLDGRTIARSSPDAAAESELAGLTSSGDVSSPAVRSRPIDFHVAGEQYVGAYRARRAGGTSTIAFVLYSSLDEALRPLRRLQRIIFGVTIGAIVLAVIVSQVVSRMLAKPVEQLVAGTERIARGEFDVKIKSDRTDELGKLARSFNQMAAGLQQRDLIKDTFGKFVDPKIVESMLADPQRLRLGGERRVQSVLFADIENFTALSEKLSPEDLFRLLNGYLEDAADLVGETHGIVDKFVGDGVVAFWGPPLEANHAACACEAALGFVRRASKHDALCDELGVPPLRVRVGVATGELLVGNIGSKTKYNYTVMGDVANLASRFEGANKLYGTQILVSARTVLEAGPTFITRRIDTVRVVGKREPVELHEVLDDVGAADVQAATRRDAYVAAMDLYFHRRWSEARVAFERINEAPAAAMAGRCAVFAESDPGSNWDGVWNLDRK